MVVILLALIFMMVYAVSFREDFKDEDLSVLTAILVIVTIVYVVTTIFLLIYN